MRQTGIEPASACEMSVDGGSCLEAPHPQEVVALWFLPAVLGTLALVLVREPLLAILGGGLVSSALCALGWALLASRPSDFETIVEVARGHRVAALSARRIWAPFNAQWRRARQYRVIARDRACQLRTLQVAFPVIGAGPVWVRLSLESRPDPNA